MDIKIMNNEELEFLGLQVNNECMDIMIKKEVQLYNIKGDDNAFISNYDIVENKILPSEVWVVFKHSKDRTTQLYFTEEFMHSNDNPIKWLLQMVILYQTIN